MRGSFFPFKFRLLVAQKGHNKPAPAKFQSIYQLTAVISGSPACLLHAHSAGKKRVSLPPCYVIVSLGGISLQKQFGFSLFSPGLAHVFICCCWEDGDRPLQTPSRATWISSFATGNGTPSWISCILKQLHKCRVIFIDSSIWAAWCNAEKKSPFSPMLTGSSGLSGAVCSSVCSREACISGSFGQLQCPALFVSVNFGRFWLVTMC